MKKSVLFLSLLAVLGSCNDAKKDNDSEIVQIADTQENYDSFGEKISAANSLSAEEMKEKYENLKPGDTIDVKFSTSVNQVCKKKGCWMTLVLPGVEEDPMIKFKDYSFFVPKDIEGRQVIVEGKAFIEETSVEDRKHFAEDAGKSREEIETITRPKHTMAFVAHGVLLKE